MKNETLKNQKLNISIKVRFTFFSTNFREIFLRKRGINKDLYLSIRNNKSSKI